MTINENQTTELIKDTLGASYTVSEVKLMLAEFTAKSVKQAPYFDGRLLDRIEKLQKSLSN